MERTKNKRIFFLALLTMTFIFLTNGYNAYAEDSKAVTVSTSTEYYEDGSYAVIEVYAMSTRAGTAGYKNYTYYDDGKAWTLTVHGSFSYDGASATCTGASGTYDIFSSAWSCRSVSDRASGNCATAIGVFYKNTGVSTSASVSLYCDANGQLS